MKKLTPTEARQRIYRYCAYQERAHSEVKAKLYEFGLTRDDVDDILSHLIAEGFLNEERFAKAFAGGKFRLKQWGKFKIIHELEAKGLTSKCIQIGLKEINDEDYQATLRTLIEKKGLQFADEENLFAKRDKIAKYVIQKGFEPELTWSFVKQIFPK
jgi:regulatory protein